MITKVFSKQLTQQVIRDLRKAGYEVIKGTGGMYECKLDDARHKQGVIFAAMPGHNGYLVRYDERLLTEAKS